MKHFKNVYYASFFEIPCEFVIESEYDARTTQAILNKICRYSIKHVFFRQHIVDELNNMLDLDIIKGEMDERRFRIVKISAS